MEADNEQKTIEEAFSQSWDRVQMLFGSYTGSDVVQWQKSMLMLIADLRKRGYDRRLHAGQSMYTFVLSHSREHGLRYEQARIAFDLNESGAMKISYREAGNLVSDFEVERVEITPEIEALLTRLLAQPID